MLNVLFTVRKRSLRRLCFYTCLSVHRGSTQAGTPPAGTPRQVHPPGRYTPLGRYPPGRYSLQAGTPPRVGTPPRQVHSLGRYTPWAGTPLGRYIPWAGTPQSNACWEIRATSGRYAPHWNAFLVFWKVWKLSDICTSKRKRIDIILHYG